MRRFKFPLMVIGILTLCTALTYWYWHLGLSPPLPLTVALILSAVVSDHRTTVKAMKLGGRECNPFMDIIFKKIGVNKGGLIVMGFLIIAIIFVFRNMPPYQQLAVGCAYWVIPINNMIVIRRFRKPKAEA